jgi:hypothetical protein
MAGIRLKETLKILIEEFEETVSTLMEGNY